MILNRRGITARSIRSYTLFATCVLLVVGMSLLSLGSYLPKHVVDAESTTLSPAATPVESVLSNLPFVFEANQGQAAPNVKFLARGSGYGLFLSPMKLCSISMVVLSVL